MFKGTQYTRITNVTVKPGTADEATRRAESQLLPLYRDEPGFVAYTVAQTGDKTLISFSIWQQREQAEKASRIGETWVKEHAGDLVESIHGHIGKLGFMETSADMVSYATVGAPTRMDAARDVAVGPVAK
jgi:quinol monooxygenase YgiN